MKMNNRNNIFNGRMPDFLIIGAMKSGTTSFFNLLGRHPSIFVPYWKELQYFSRDYKFALGEKFYTDHFIEARADQIVGEGSTCYSRWPQYPHAAQRIAERLPDVRLIYLMRHPVERAYSHYGHIIQDRIIKKSGRIVSFDQALINEKEIIYSSLYKIQIEKYLSFFKPNQMLFLTFDELITSPTKLLRRTQEFLKVKPIDLYLKNDTKDNQWGDKIAKNKIRKIVRHFNKFSHFIGINRYLPEFYRQYLVQSVVNSKALNTIFKAGLQRKKEILSPIRQDTREFLLEIFEESTDWLEKYMGWELPNWHQ